MGGAYLSACRNTYSHFSTNIDDQFYAMEEIMNRSVVGGSTLDHSLISPKGAVCMRSNNIFHLVSLALLLSICFGVNALAADHLRSEIKRTYAGNTWPTRVSDLWIGEKGVYLKSGRFVTIFRFDLGKRWTMKSDSTLYAEEPLTRPDTAENQDQDIHKLGYSYTPRYVWDLERTDRVDTLNGLVCKKIILHGDADYSTKTMEIWLTKDVSVDIQRMYRSFVDYTADDVWRSIYRSFPDLKDFLLVRAIETEEPPIASTIVVEKLITTAERVETPAGMFEIPSGCRKVTSRDDLYK